MIFGKIEYEVEKKHRDANHFAWLPVLLMDGRWAWLETVNKKTWKFGEHSGNVYYLPRLDLTVGEWRIQSER